MVCGFSSVLITSTDRYIVSGSWDATAKIWSREQRRRGELVHEFRFPDGREVSQVKVAGKGGRRIFVASLGQTPGNAVGIAIQGCHM